MEISMGLAKALARFGYIQTHAAETLVARTRENDRLISMLQGRAGPAPRLAPF